MTPSNLEYGVRPHGSAQVMSLIGEVDIAGVPALKSFVEELIRGGSLDLIYDLTKVDAIDSTGLGFLVWSRKRLREHAGRLRLVVDRPQVQRVLKLTGLARLFETYANLEDALAQPAATEDPSEPDRFRPQEGNGASSRK